MTTMEFQQLLTEAPFQLHTTVFDFTTRQRIANVRADEVFSSASMIKVPILIAVLHQLEQSGRSLHEKLTIAPQQKVDFSVLTEQDAQEVSLYDALLWMIITSDNSATNVCIDYLGMNTLNAFFVEQGWHKTKVQRKMMDFARQQAGFDNEMSAADCEQIFTALYDGTGLSPEMNTIALHILNRQRSHESLRRYIPDDVRVAHKTGGLDTVDHDAGIFYHPNGDYYIGVFMTNVTNNEIAKRFIGQLSKAVFDQWTKGGVR